jgi:hypothetical protein
LTHAPVNTSEGGAFPLNAIYNTNPLVTSAEERGSKSTKRSKYTVLGHGSLWREISTYFLARTYTGQVSYDAIVAFECFMYDQQQH